MLLFRMALNVVIALADNLSSSVLKYFLKGQAPSGLEETSLGGRDSAKLL